MTLLFLSACERSTESVAEDEIDHRYEEVKTFLLDRFPEALDEINLEEPEVFEETVNYAYEFMEEYRARLEDSGRENADLWLDLQRGILKSDRLAEDYHSADSASERQKARIKLRREVGATLDRRLELERAELEALEREIADIREFIREQENSREDLLDEELEAYLSDDEDEETDDHEEED